MMPGLAKLTEEIAAEAPAGLVDELWRLVYTRGHCDVDRARPHPGRDHAGILVHLRTLDRRRVLAIVDTGERLIGALATSGPPAPLASAVRLTPGGPAGWRLMVDEALPLPIDVRFERAPDAGERGWVALLREALCEIRAAEAVRRDGIAARRRALPPFVTVPAGDDVVRRHIGALRSGIAREMFYVPSRAGDAKQRERYESRVKEALEEFRRELPALHQRIRDMQVANATTRGELERLENAYAESRARTQATYGASRWLDALAHAPLVVTGLDAVPEGLDEPARANEVLRTIALLARALPRGGSSVAV